MLLEGKIAIVTGAATEQGIGRATARLFAAEGARLAMLDIDETGLAEAAAELGDGHRTYRCDVADDNACQAVTRQIAADFGGIDILVNNAGLVYGTPILEITRDEYDAVLDVNLRGNFNMAQAAVPFLRQRGGGAIVCVSSIAGQSGGGVFGRAHYAAAKAGIMGLAKALGRELAPDNIRANAIAAGSVDNNFTKGRMTPEIKAKVAANVPMGRLGRPDEIASVCLFLASDLASYVTGSVIDANGGLLIH
jgi:NAD(P)-dependent dehydrogenase (short-subunit alcohol dehydrogenase family)